MANQPIVLNGTSFTPSAIDREETKIGNEKRAINGTLRFAHRAFKNRWTITWSGVSPSVVSSVRAIYRLVASFVYFDEDGTQWTVICLPGGFSSTIDAQSISLNGSMYYEVTLTIDEV